MPNWCHNQLIIIGEEDQVNDASEFIKSSEPGSQDILDFQKIIPLEDSEEWYEQRIAAWGTKWNAADTSNSIDMDGTVNVYAVTFSTAWGPSVPVTLALSDKYPNLSFIHEYDEPGVGFAGVVLARAGAVVNGVESENMIPYALVLAPGLVLANPGWRSEETIACEHGTELDRARTALAVADPFRCTGGIFNLVDDSVEKVEESAMADVLASLEGPEVDRTVQGWLEVAYSPAPGFNSFLAAFNADTANGKELALYTCLNLVAQTPLGERHEYWHSDGESDRTVFNFTQWHYAWEDLLEAGVSPSVAMALINKILDKVNTPQELVKTITEVVKD